MDIFALLQLLPKIVGTAGTIQEALRTGGNVLEIIKKIIPEVLPLLIDLGKTTFPTADPAKAASAGVSVMYGSDSTKWVQSALNRLGQTPPLTVDGSYGQMTKAAVSAYQTKHGLKVDGWAGAATSGSLGVEVAKLTPASA